MSRMLPSVSVIVRAYNAEKYIEEAILSIVNQTYEGLIEIVVCFDEGSKTRQALEIVEQLRAKYQNERRIFKIVSHPPLSPFRALLYGLNFAEGDYIAFLDYDNVYDKDFIRSLVSRMISEKADMAFGTMITTDSKLNPIGVSNPPERVRLKDLLVLNFMDISSLMISRKALKTIVDRLSILHQRYFDWIFEDYLIALISTKESLNVVHAKEAKYFYRLHESNITASVKKDAMRYLMNREREMKTFIAFYYIYKDKLNLSERIQVLSTILRASMAIPIRGLCLPLSIIVPVFIATFLQIIKSRFKRGGS